MMPNAKLGLLVAWPAWWTGFPVKLVIAVLMLAAQVHPWEGGGLYALLLLSIPIDIWALGLCARTVLLERLRVDPPRGMGLRLWASWAAFSAVALPLACAAVSVVKTAAVWATDGTLHWVQEHLFTVPIAERISLELAMIGAPVTVVLLAALYGWMFGLGWLAQRVVRASTPVDGEFQEIVRTWDLLRVPKDQPLVLTVLTGTVAGLIMLFWAVLPVSTPHPHEEYEFVHVKKTEPRIVPREVITSTERILSRAEATLKAAEKDAKKK